jgi:DNA ligase-1
MHALARLIEELESRPDDADRVDALARWLRAAGRDAGALAGAWLVAAPGARPARPPRVTQAALLEAARALAAGHGTAPWLFDAGVAASGEQAEAIALLLPWPDAVDAPHPTLADWLADWAAAVAQPVPSRAAAIAHAIARIDDALARRWAVRAACGLGRPPVDEWQWQRAWAQAFGLDAHAVAWWWHEHRAHLRHDVTPAALPRPGEFAALTDAPEALHDALMDGWRRGEWHVEPRWPGLRVQVVRRGDRVAVWQRGGALLNARLPADWLAPAPWPEGGVVEALLLAAEAGRVVALAEAWVPRTRAASAGTTLHLALVDWLGAAGTDAERRAWLRARWPAPDVAADAALPAIFSMPVLAPADATLQAHADDVRRHGAGGLVLRHGASAAAWTVRAQPHRVCAVLQYVPSELLAADPAAARALADAPCGFALWNRLPRSEAEQHAAMTASLSGQFLPSPDDAPGEEGLRLLPLARLPLALPLAELLRLHAWLRDNVGQRFGGVQAVAPVQVFEIGFAQARPSARHRLGATLAGARVLRWLHDAPPGGAQLAEELASV